MVDTTTIAVIIVVAIVLLGLVMFIMICKQLNRESPAHAARITQKQMRRQSRLLSSAFTKHHFSKFTGATPRSLKAPIPEVPAENEDDGNDVRDSVEGGAIQTCNRGSLGQESAHPERDLDEGLSKRGDDVTSQSEGKASGGVMTSGIGTDSTNNVPIFVTVPSPTDHDQPTVRFDIDKLPPIVSSKPNVPVYDYRHVGLPSIEQPRTRGPTPEEATGTELDRVG